MKRFKRFIVSLLACMLTLVLLVPPVLATTPSVADPLRYSIQLDEKNNRLQLQVVNPTIKDKILLFLPAQASPW